MRRSRCWPGRVVRFKGASGLVMSSQQVGDVGVICRGDGELWPPGRIRVVFFNTTNTYYLRARHFCPVSEPLK